MTTAEELRGIMEFDHVIHVDENGTVTDPTGVYAPTLHDEKLDDSSWSLMTGYTGQYGYRGPIMHDSEYIGGRMAGDILTTPGYYVTLVSYYTGDGEENESNAEGWAVAYRPLDSEEEEEEEEAAHVGHFSRLGGQWWCDTCNSPYCEKA